MERLYCITRKDLTPGQKTAQACHAATQYILDNPKTNWDNGFIICLEIDSEQELLKLKESLDIKGLNYSYFKEPDMGDALTAISMLDHGKTFANLKLLR